MSRYILDENDFLGARCDEFVNGLATRHGKGLGLVGRVNRLAIAQISGLEVDTACPFGKRAQTEYFSAASGLREVG